MRMSKELFAELKLAIDLAGGIPAGASLRKRWDILFGSLYPVSRLYAAGLNDNHIDTALRAMVRS